jgi:hypothetical protein
MLESLYWTLYLADVIALLLSAGRQRTICLPQAVH